MRSILILLVVLLTVYTNGYGQEGNCSKPKIAVILKEIVEDDNISFIDYLNEQYPSQPEDVWINQIQTKVLGELKKNSPDTEFVSVSGGVPDNCDFIFEYSLSLSAGGREIIDDLFTDPVIISKYTVYKMVSELRSSPACAVPSANLDSEFPIDDPDNQDIFVAIEKNVATFGNIGDQIDEYENSHLVPPRGPKMKISKNKDYVSPLKDKRSLNIKIDITNCKGETVYDIDHGQLVFLPKKPERGENKPTKGFPQELIVTQNVITLIIVRPKGASATYELKNGVDAHEEKIKIKTCGLDDEVVKEQEIPIYGLEIRVKPNRKQIFTDERTDIKLIFNETDTEGNKYPVEGKDLMVKVNGLVNGTIKAKDGYTTDENGEVILNYKAGDDDKKISITASYQPVDYPDKAEGKSSITVKPLEYDATLTLKKKIAKRIIYNKEENSATKFCSTKEKKNHKLNETIEASIYVTLKLREVAEMPMYNQRWEYYEPITINLSNFSINLNDKRVDYRNSTGYECASGGFETTITKRKRLTKKEIEGMNIITTLPWIVTFDNETGKALKIIPVGYGVAYEYDETEKFHTSIWSKDGNSEDSGSDTKTRTRTFGVGPVEDPKPDPTAKSSEQWIQDYIKKNIGDIPPEIAAQIPKTDPKEMQNDIRPDVIVQFGDGKTNFGGKGRKFINEPNPYGFEQEEQTYSWQMTRKRKAQ